MYRILIIDDNKILLNSLSLFLKSEGFEVETVDNSINGIIKVKEESWDLVLLDYYLGDMDGQTFLSITSEFTNRPKIAIFTANHDEEIELSVLNGHAEDYIRKTENPKILASRIRRILNDNTERIERLVSSKYNIEVNLEFRSVKKDDEDIILTNTEFEILALFLRNKNKVLTREKIYEKVWAKKNKFLDEFRTIDVHVLNLRKKIQVDSIMNRKGVGYVWIEE